MQVDGTEFQTPVQEELKIWIVVRQDIDMPLGKAITQGGHGVDATLEDAAIKCPERLAEYRKQARPKITVRVPSLESLARGYTECVAAGLPCAMITDAARTTFDEPTVTVFAVGPCYRQELPKFVQKLRLL